MSIMDPQFFSTILKPKVVDGREVVTVAHHADTCSSIIDGTDNSGTHGSMWHMDESDPDPVVACINLQLIMQEMGWRITEENWGWLEDENIYFADFERIPS